MAVLEKDEDEYDEYDVEKAHATPSVSPPRLVPRAVPTVVDTALPVVDRLAQAEWQQWSSPLRTSRPQRVATQQEERARAAPLGTHSPYRDDIARSTLHKIHGRAPEPEVTGSDLIEQHPLWKMELDLSGRGLPEVAGSIGSLTDLREVNLARNLLVELPKEVGRLRKLRVLDLSRNMLAALPPSLGCLHQLERLVASHNMLEMLPSTLGALEHLRTLDVSQNKLRRLPDSFGLSQPVMTEEAAFGKAAAVASPKQPEPPLGRQDPPLGRQDPPLGRLSALAGLDVSYNHLESLPMSLGRLESLTSIDASHNRLGKLPALGGLQRLRTLHLSDNQLQTLPEHLGMLASLTALKLTGNPPALTMALYRSEWWDASPLKLIATLSQSAESVAWRAAQRSQARRQGIADVYAHAAEMAGPMYVKAKLAAEDVKRLDRHAATVDFGVRRDDMQYGDLMELHLHSRVGRAPKPPYDHTMKVKVGVEWHGIGSPRLTSAAREGATTLRRVYQGTAAEQFAALEAIAAKKAAREALAAEAVAEAHAANEKAQAEIQEMVERMGREARAATLSEPGSS